MSNDDALYDKTGRRLECVSCGRTVEKTERTGVHFEGEYHCSNCTGRGGIEYYGRDSMG